MPVSKAQVKATTKYMKNNYDSLRIITKKGEREYIKAHAAEMGESLNGFVNRAIRETLERDKAQ